ncbi:MAG: hypothetical protein K6G75_07780 [Lachnospiraceae bacterium]|nr:hypothetical protein [Lachnospiraceae bacterium]
MEEKKIYTPNRLVICSVKTDSFGNKILHRKNGKREDDISLTQFLQQVFSDENDDNENNCCSVEA